jgi:2-dehydro-3-deoxygluconokinase
LPSFDDEAKLWGDGDPEATVKRMTAAGVREIVVKNGQETVALFNDGALSRVPTPAVKSIRDTTGAGDSFNAGYLAGRLVGMSPLNACQLGQEVAGEIISHFGALAPESSLERFRSHIRDHVKKS